MVTLLHAATKYSHQVTAFVFNSLMQDAFQKSQSEKLTDDENFSIWQKKNEDLFPQFQHWSIALNMEMDYLLSSLHVHALEKILSWTFVFDHFNYARWLSVYLHDMEVLHETKPLVFEKFKHQGNSMISRARNAFSAMGLDQQHEQKNKDVKGDG